MSDENSGFQNIFHEKQVQSKNRLNDFLAEPGEEQIHQLRTSIRRLEAMYFIFPNSCKRKKIDIFVSSYKLLFKKNSSIRDMDVIIKRLQKNGLSKESKIIKKIVHQKNKKIKKILKDVEKISKLEFSNLKKINDEKIIQKHDKKIFSLITKIQDYIPIVISDESKIDELHSMRKTAKKLRYILEIDPNGKYCHVVESMKTFQKLLGSIHDCDITIDFLKKYAKKESELDPLLTKEKKIRSEVYHQLADSLSTATI